MLNFAIVLFDGFLRSYLHISCTSRRQRPGDRGGGPNQNGKRKEGLPLEFFQGELAGVVVLSTRQGSRDGPTKDLRSCNAQVNRSEGWGGWLIGICIDVLGVVIVENHEELDSGGLSRLGR